MVKSCSTKSADWLSKGHTVKSFLQKVQTGYVKVMGSIPVLQKEQTQI